MKTFTLITCLGLVALGAANAQELNRFAFSLGAGFTTPVGTTGRNLDVGWNIGGGFGYNFNSYVGALIDLNYNSMGINSGTLANVGVPGGDVHIFAATLDPIVHLTPKSRVDLYLTGGGGLYHRTQEFTAPAAATVEGFNPFFGFYSYGVPATEILASYTVNKPGIDAGMGIALGSKWHGKFFAEARYNRIFMGNYHTDYLPVTFGFRW
jgi:Outer membrane protein beta-barrel domain